MGLTAIGEGVLNKDFTNKDGEDYWGVVFTLGCLAAFGSEFASLVYV